MKGYAQVLNTDIKFAIENHISLITEISKIKDQATLDHYNKYYTQSNVFNRLIHKKSSPSQFLWARLGKWEFNVDKLLNEFMTFEQIQVCAIPDYGDKDNREQLKSLLELTTDDTCLLGEEFCSYVKKYKAIKF